MHLDPILTQFALVVTFAFLIGLEIKTYRQQFHPENGRDFFGSTRTMTFVGIMGLVLYKIDPVHLTVYIVGLVGFTALYSLFYQTKLEDGKNSILLYLVSVLIYAFGPLSDRYAFWVVALLFVLVVFVLNAKRGIQRFTEEVNAEEFETLGKMVLLSGVILPLLPNEKVFAYIPLSPFKIWLAVVIISAISYGGYLLQKYIFKNRGFFVAGVLGGLYSSTATTVVLARKLKERGSSPVIDAGIVAATSMMYLRLIVVAAVFNMAITRAILPAFLLFALIGLMLSFYLVHLKEPTRRGVAFVDQNPLELGTALFFAGLFLFMMVLTTYITQHYGDLGLKILSFVTGLTDIDPFILSLLTGKFSVTQQEIVSAIMIAAGSNNILKALYAVWFGGWRAGLRAGAIIFVLGIATVGWGLWGGEIPRMISQ